MKFRTWVLAFVVLQLAVFLALHNGDIKTVKILTGTLGITGTLVYLMDLEDSERKRREENRNVEASRRFS